MSNRKQRDTRNPNKANVQESPLLKIIIAIIGATALIIVALINRSTAKLPADFTQTAEARHTMNALTSQSAQASPVALITAETTAPYQVTKTTPTSPTEEFIITPTTKILFEDSFNDNRNNWYLGSSTPYILAGVYGFLVNCPADNDAYYCGKSVAIPFDFPANYRLEMDITVSESSPDADIAIGYQLRKNKFDHYYINYYITERFYSIWMAYNNNYSEIISKEPAELISNELWVTNRLGIKIQDEIFIPLINGVSLAQIEDGNLLNAGDTYFTIYISRGSSARIQFDNLSVQEVK